MKAVINVFKMMCCLTSGTKSWQVKFNHYIHTYDMHIRWTSTA